MNLTRKAVLATAMVGSTLVGGAIGAAVFGPHLASAQTSSSSTTTPAQGSGQAPGQPPTAGDQPNGTFHSNENATHEAGESAQREAQENAGQFPTVP